MTEDSDGNEGRKGAMCYMLSDFSSFGDGSVCENLEGFMESPATIGLKPPKSTTPRISIKTKFPTTTVVNMLLTGYI